jgi:hypothetical protein
MTENHTVPSMAAGRRDTSSPLKDRLQTLIQPDLENHFLISVGVISIVAVPISVIGGLHDIIRIVDVDPSRLVCGPVPICVVTAGPVPICVVASGAKTDCPIAACAEAASTETAPTETARMSYFCRKQRHEHHHHEIEISFHWKYLS